MPYFKGNLNQYERKRSVPPAWENKRIAGKRGENYSIVRVWVYRASAEYPQIGINLGISNGAGSAFTQMSPEEFKDLMAFFRESETEILNRLPVLENEKQILEQAKAKSDELMRMLRMQLDNQEEQT